MVTILTWWLVLIGLIGAMQPPIETEVEDNPVFSTESAFAGEAIGDSPPSTTLEDALANSSWPEHLWPTVIKIAQCESGLNPAAVGDQGRAHGLMQIRVDAHPVLANRYDLFSYEGALAASWEIYTDAGSFRPWSCAR